MTYSNFNALTSSFQNILLTYFSFLEFPTQKEMRTNDEYNKTITEMLIVFVHFSYVLDIGAKIFANIQRIR